MLTPLVRRRLATCCALIAPALAASACGRDALPIGFGMPNLRFESSESYGTGRGFAGVAVGSRPRAITVTDAGSDPPIRAPKIDGGIGPTYAAGIGVMNRLDVSVAYSPAGDPESQAPLMARAKWQIVGAPAKSARRGGNSLALMAGVGKVAFDREDNTTFIEGATSRGATVARHGEATVVEGALLGGRRLTDRTLLYGSLGYSRYEYSWSVNQSSSRGPRAYADAGHAGEAGVNAGLQYARGAFLVRIEGALARESLGPVGHIRQNAGVQAGFKW